MCVVFQVIHVWIADRVDGCNLWEERSAVRPEKDGRTHYILDRRMDEIARRAIWTNTPHERLAEYPCGRLWYK